METTNQNVIKDHLLQPKQTSILLQQKNISFCWTIVLLSLFGIDSIEFNRSEDVEALCKVEIGENFDPEFVERFLSGCQVHFH